MAHTRSTTYAPRVSSLMSRISGHGHSQELFIAACMTLRMYFMGTDRDNRLPHKHVS